MDFGFLTKATGIVFRESFEAALIYGIIVSYFSRYKSESRGLKSAQVGLVLGVLASLVLGVAFAGAIPSFSPEVFSLIEILIVLGGSLMMLYMVFWMSEHSRHLKHQIESGIQQNGSYSIIASVFVAVFREGIETVVYLYSLAFERPSLAHSTSVMLSLALGVSLAFVIYRFMVQGSKYLSIKTVFRISGFWLLLSSSSLLATGLDKIYSAGWLEKFSEPLFSFELPAFLSPGASLLESFAGVRMQPTLFHLISFSLFWFFIFYKDPLRLRPAVV